MLEIHQWRAGHSCSEIVFHESLTVPYILWSAELTTFVLGYFLKDVYIGKRLGRYSLLFQSEEVWFSYSLG